jgi:hypothetical protein
VISITTQMYDQPVYYYSLCSTKRLLVRSLLVASEWQELPAKVEAGAFKRLGNSAAKGVGRSAPERCDKRGAGGGGGHLGREGQAVQAVHQLRELALPKRDRLQGSRAVNHAETREHGAGERGGIKGGGGNLLLCGLRGLEQRLPQLDDCPGRKPPFSC